MLEQVKEVFAAQLHLNASEIADDANILEDLGADSLDIVEILMSLEDTMGISVPDEDALELKTIRDVADYLTAKTGK